MDKKDIFILVICTSIAFYLGFKLHESKYSKLPQESYSTVDYDSLTTLIVDKIKKVNISTNSTITHFKIRRNEIDSIYQTIGNIQFVDDNDSLVRSVLLLTSDGTRSERPCN